MTLGLFGGTFDPVHRGHLDVAEAARRALGLDHIWFVPARLPPHRGSPRASAAHRFAMTALAIEDTAGLLVSDLEMETRGPSYTSETLDRLAARGFDTRDVCFITGADAFLDITAWKNYPQLLDRCRFGVVSRPGTSVLSLPTALPTLAVRMVAMPNDVGCRFETTPDVVSATSAPATPSIFLVDAPTAPVSSTDVRRAIAAGQPLAGLVPPRVAAYIDRHGLYAPSTALDGSL